MINNILILDQEHQDIFKGHDLDMLTPIEYILGEPTENNNVYNLSSKIGYQELGYYASLLAMARSEKMYPAAKTIQDFKDKKIQKLYSDEMDDLFQSKLKNLIGSEFELSIYFGENLSTQYNQLCWELYRVVQAPMFRVYFSKKDKWKISKIQLLTIDDLNAVHQEFLVSRAVEYFKNKKTFRVNKNKFIYDLAILYNENEESPPSNKKALKSFMQGFKEVGIKPHMVQAKEKPYIAEYDALFIRETTNVLHHTYKLARLAEKEGLVVVDDPDSIVKCTNKVFLEQLMSTLKVPRPKSLVLDRKLFERDFKKIPCPCVIKKPDSAFSEGVYKAKDHDELLAIAKTLFQKTDLILIQEFIPTEFDWRIGVLGGEIIYACKYFMAKDHWQIVNHQNGKDSIEGDFESLELSKIPEVVAKIALKSTKAIGNGLYGVDLKQIGSKVYLIEVNDNPNLDGGIEDQFLKDELYYKIALYFLKELSLKRKII